MYACPEEAQSETLYGKFERSEFICTSLCNTGDSENRNRKVRVRVNVSVAAVIAYMERCP